MFQVAGLYLDKCKDLYSDAQEMITWNMSETLRTSLVIKADVDANHVGDLVNRRSHPGIIIYIINVPIIRYSKNSNMFETSSFGLEFVVLKN